jgi:DNA invertase Pin-like site-specific DNA recombinase
MAKAIALLRVSTKRQGKSRWGLEAQHERVDDYRRLTGTEVLNVYEEIVSGKEKRANRPVLNRIIRECRKHDAFILIATLDRLARNFKTIEYLLDSGVKFVVADMPFATRYQILHKALDDEEDGERISERTRLGLQQAKKKGVILGKNGKLLAAENKRNADAFAVARMPDVERERNNGFKSEGQLMRRFNDLGITSARGRRWHPQTIHALLKRIEKLKSEASNENRENNISSILKTGT